MILLPKDLRITRDEHTEVRTVQRFREWLDHQDSSRTKGIHASDLLDPRLSYWESALPRELTERQVFFFTIGKVLHSLVLNSPEHGIDKSDLGTSEALGILFSPDAATHDGSPIELKTNRSAYEPHEDKLIVDYQIYLEQLLIYCILQNCLRGELWVLYISLKDPSGRTFPDLRCYSVELTQTQFHTLEQQIIATRDLLLKAKKEKNHRILPLCRNWKCGTNCVYFNECRPEGRYPQKDKKRWTA